jgi:hypothetical protein
MSPIDSKFSFASVSCERINQLIQYPGLLVFEVFGDILFFGYSAGNALFGNR